MNVIFFTPIDQRHNRTGSCRQIVCGETWAPAAGLAICRDEFDDCFYLLGCDSEWNCVTDTWHQSVEEAMDQAEFEYTGVTSTWAKR